MEDGAIQVSVRVRPLNKKEAGNVEGWVCSDTEIQSSGGGPTTKNKKFEFNHVFHPGSQQDVYDKIASPIVKKVLRIHVNNSARMPTELFSFQGYAGIQWHCVCVWSDGQW
jgi:hypothetical protein